MTIVYPITMPSSPGPVRAEIRARPVVAETRSPFTLARQVQEYAGQNWELDLSYPPMTRSQAEPWLAALLQLNGTAGTFLFGPPGGRVPRGSAAGSPVVAGAGQSGNELATSGWTPSASGVLLVGDWIQLGAGETAQLHKVLQQVDADGGGLATLTLWPRLQSSPPDGSAIVTTSPVGRWQLAAAETGWDLSTVMHYGLSIVALGARP